MSAVPDWREAFGEGAPFLRPSARGGYARVFRRLGVVGDSLAAGEFETVDENGVRRYHDRYEYSWAAHLGHAIGAEIVNFSRGGMTAEEFLTSWAEERGFWDPKLACQGYLMALGVNDLFFRETPCGTLEDARALNLKVFAGQFAEIMRRYRAVQPEAKFFLITMPRGQETEAWDRLADRHAELMREMASAFPGTYLIDLREHAPVFDEAFRKVFYLEGHLNPMGYILVADLITACLDGIVRRHYEDFRLTGLV